MVAGEGESVDEEPEKSGNPQWQGPGGEKVQGKVFNPGVDQRGKCGQKFYKSDQCGLTFDQRGQPASSSKPTHVHVGEAKRGEEAADHGLDKMIIG